MTGWRRWRSHAVIGLAIASASIALASPGGARAATSAYVPIDLGSTSPLLPAGSAVAVNDAGEVVGTAGGAMAWTQTTGVTPLSNGGIPTAISPNGRIAGTADDYGPTSSDLAFAWTSAADTAPVELGTLGGNATHANAINDAGEVVGQSSISNENPYDVHAFVWTPAGGMIDIGTLGGPTSSATGVNASGVVVGWSDVPAGLLMARHAFRWTPAGGMADLGSIAAGSNSEATAISDSGQIVGNIELSGSLDRYDAFSWTQAGGLVDIGELLDLPASSATAVSDSGQVVGTGGGSQGVAFSWTAAGGVVYLGGLGGTDAHAFGVNDSGLIVGESTTPDNTEHATIWTPVGAPPIAPSRPFLLDADPFRTPTTATSTGWGYRDFNVCGYAALADGTATVFRDGSAIGTAAVDPTDGSWCFYDHVPADGTFDYSATLTDALDRTSAGGGSFDIVVSTSPTVTITGAPSGTYDVTDIPARPSFTATSFGSALAPVRESWVGPSTPSGIGEYVYTVTAQDVFGHQTIGTRTYDVVYGTALTVPPATSRYALGDTIPVRFQAVDGGPITGVVASLTVTPGSQVGYLAPWPSPPASTRLAYDPSTQQYALDLHTDRAYTNPDGTTVASFAPGIYTLTIALDDGTTRTRQITLTAAPLRIARAAAIGAKATAGHVLSLSFAVSRHGGAQAPTGVQVSFTARIGTRTLRGTHSYRDGAAHLTLAIPRGTRGLLLTVHLRIAAGGTTTMRVSTYRIH